MSTQPLGRPSTYSEDIGNKLCELVASGLSRNKAAQKLNIPVSTVRAWEKENESFFANYTRAEEERANHFFELGNEIALKIASGEDAQVARVQLDWLKWSTSRLWPRKYGDKPADVNVGVNVGLQLVHSIPRPERQVPEISADGQPDGQSGR